MPSLLPSSWLQSTPEAISKLAPFQHADWPEFALHGVEVSIKREDLLDPYIGGNKLYKLWGYLRDHQESYSALPIATFGGAFSNHIYATAAVGSRLGIPTIGIIRGEKPKVLSPTLNDALNFGMKLHFVTRTEYRERHNPEYLRGIERLFGSCYWVPEGGAGVLGALGCRALATILQGEVNKYSSSEVVLACGTATTLAGIRAGLADSTRLMGISVLKGEGILDDSVRSILSQISSRWTNLSVNYQFHCGGYAKLPQYLKEFIHKFEEKTGIPLDPVYTGKLMWGLSQLAKHKYWQEGTKLVVLHSGGLQGRRGYPGVFRETHT